MLQKVFAIRDAKTEAFMRPFFVPTNGVAIRSFSDEVNNRESELAKHPEDYALFELGVFDDSNGSFDLLEQPKSLGLALEFVKGA